MDSLADFLPGLIEAGLDWIADEYDIGKLQERYGKAKLLIVGRLHEDRFRLFSHYRSHLIGFEDTALFRVRNEQLVSIPLGPLNFRIKKSVWGIEIHMKLDGDAGPGTAEKYIFQPHKISPRMRPGSAEFRKALGL